MKRGYSAVGLHAPKNVINFGGVMRAAFNYNASLVVMSGRRFQKQASDTTACWRHIPLIESENLFDANPYDCIPVAVDLIEGATLLPNYVHPERAFYIFGAEDQTLGVNITSRCKDIIYVPTNRCMNLSAAVNVVLYDRMCKRGEWDK